MGNIAAIVMALAIIPVAIFDFINIYFKLTSNIIISETSGKCYKFFPRTFCGELVELI